MMRIGTFLDRAARVRPENAQQALELARAVNLALEVDEREHAEAERERAQS